LSEFSRGWLLYLGLTFLVMVMHAPGGLASIIIANWHVVRRGYLRRLLPMYLALFAGAAPALFGAAALVEMLYHRQLNAMLGSTLSFMGLNLNTASLASWLTGVAVCLAGVILLETVRRRFVKNWQVIQYEIGQIQCQETE
jgi:branched-chain amino acid transport system permease protein